MKQPVALLQTDIVDSTRLGERLGDAGLAVFREEHDRIARDLLGAWNGHELERSDGFLMRFDCASDAAEYAIAYHRAIKEMVIPIEVRAGLHIGHLDFRSNSDAHVALGAKAIEAVGLLIPTTVRVMSLATGTQTLLTIEAKSAIGSTGRRIVSHGYWRLKGLDEPIELFEIGDEDAPFSPPPDSLKAYRVVRRNEYWLPRGALPTNLPAERNAFIGRKPLLAELAQRFESGARLVSIVGTGGVGKTRLVQHFCWSRLGDFGGGVWFCDLSQANSFDGLCGAVAQGLGLPPAPTDPIEQIGSAIAGRDDCLVVLDNCEQIVGQVVQALGRWLDRAVGARFLVTTRTVLGIDGEDVLALQPMNRSEGVDLFVSRAYAASGDFAIRDDNVRLLEETVALLDALPLAIELAAARVRVMSLEALHTRMQDRFAILSSRGGRPNRQATLRATFDWSWDLLTAQERSAMAQLSVFEGGFTLEACEEVLDIAFIDSASPTFEVLQSLVEKSWIQRTNERRFTLLRSVQEYAAEHLLEDGLTSTGSATEKRHWRYFGRLEEIQAIADRCIEIDNLIAAARRAAKAGDGGGATAVLRGCWAAIKLRGPFRTAIELGEQVRALERLDPTQRAWIQYVIGNGLRYSGRASEALEYFEAGLAHARTAASRVMEARLLASIGEQWTVAGRHAEARMSLDEAMTVANNTDYTSRCIVLNALGSLERMTGAAHAAIKPYQDALALARAAGDRHWEGGLVGNLGVSYHTLGRLDEAQNHYEQALTLAQWSGDQRWEGNTRCNLGLLLQEKGLYEDSRTQLELALVKARELGFVRLEFVVSSNLGLLADKTNAFDDANLLFLQAIELAERLGDRRASGETMGYRAALLGKRGQRQEAEALFAEGEKLLVEAGDDAGRAQLLCSLALLQCDLGDLASARVQWENIEAAIAGLDTASNAPLAMSLARLRSHLTNVAPFAVLTH